MISAVGAFPSCDQVQIVWRLDAMIPGCAGFAVFRQTEDGQTEALNTWVGFAGEAPAEPGDHKPSTEWPVQKTSWIDFLAPETGKVRYGVAQVLFAPGSADAAVQVTPPDPPKDGSSAWSGWVSLDQGDAPVTAWFNRGTISAQWLTRKLDIAGGKPAQTLAAIINDPDDPVRQFLAGPARVRLIGHLDEAIANQRDIYAALFELNDPELIGKLKQLGAKAHLVLGNSDGGNSNNQRATDASAALIAAAGVDLVRRAIAPSRFAHNKFVVFTDATGQPERVWTGSINWTETGVCTQNSNGLDVFDAVAAAAFRAHWQKLHDAGEGQIVETNAYAASIAGRAVDMWFTPAASHADLLEATALIKAAKTGILFLMLNPGPAGLLGPIVERLSPLDGDYDPNLYVRGVLNNFPNRAKSDAQDQLSLLTSEGKVQQFTAGELAGVLKPAWISQGAGAWWEKELSATGKFAIAVHSKVIVLDPSGDNPVVMTGSHNFSNRASTANDDNLVIVKGDRTLAQTYAVNIMGIYNEYRFRAWRNTPAGQQDKGLQTSDGWLQQRIDAQWLARETAFWLGPKA